METDSRFLLVLVSVTQGNWIWTSTQFNPHSYLNQGGLNNSQGEFNVKVLVT